MEKLINIIITNSDNLITAAFILTMTFIAGFASTRVLKGSLVVTGKITGKKLVEIEASQMTRLKMAKRIILLAIYLTGIAAALYQFAPFQRLGTALLASVGLFGVIAGIASRSSLANMLAGLIIAFAQPFILGDKITVGEDSGVVKEITLLYTILKGEDGLIIIPNSILSEATIKNHTAKIK